MNRHYNFVRHCVGLLADHEDRHSTGTAPQPVESCQEDRNHVQKWETRAKTASHKAAEPAKEDAAAENSGEEAGGQVKVTVQHSSWERLRSLRRLRERRNP